MGRSYIFTCSISVYDLLVYKTHPKFPTCPFCITMNLSYKTTFVLQKGGRCYKGLLLTEWLSFDQLGLWTTNKQQALENGYVCWAFCYVVQLHACCSCWAFWSFCWICFTIDKIWQTFKNNNFFFWPQSVKGQRGGGGMNLFFVK